MVVQMINVGEQTGGLDEMLTKIADFYDEEVDAAVEALLAAMEPIMIVVLGVIVGGMIVAMYLPIFDTRCGAASGPLVRSSRWGAASDDPPRPAPRPPDAHPHQAARMINAVQ
jgi:hypothetical protein